MSIRAILEKDEKEPMDDHDLDDAIWLSLCERISSPEHLKHFQPQVAVFYASYLMEHEVGNGGFAQAALNIPEWFELAAEAYRALGKSAVASLIMKVYQQLSKNEEIARKFRSGEIQWEDYFADHSFNVYNKLVYESNEWEITTERIAYVRANREAFKCL